MKFLLIVCALVGVATAATLPDSATQGPNPQDIATPEPEYIDIDLPESAPAPKSAPSANIISPAPRPIQQVSFAAPAVHHQVQHQVQHHLPLQQLPGHYHGASGYQYRRPVFIRRVYRRRY